MHQDGSGNVVGRRQVEVRKDRESKKATVGTLGVAGGLAAMKGGAEFRVRSRRAITSSRNTAMGARHTAENSSKILEEMRNVRPKVGRSPSGKSTGRLHTFADQSYTVARNQKIANNQARRATATARLLRKPMGTAQNVKLGGAAAAGVGSVMALRGLAGMARNRRDRAIYGQTSA